MVMEVLRGVLGWLARQAGALEPEQEELARTAVAGERLRFARDVHDLLGLSLSAVTLKAELADRLLAADPELAKQQLVEIGELARRACADVRSVVDGYVDLRLDDELQLARAVLSSAEIQVQVSRAGFVIPAQHERVLATVTREAVTNVLRHSKAERCEISLRRRRGRVQLDIVNDGLTRARPATPACGDSGIGNLKHRVAELGGWLAAGAEPNGTYRLLATVPLTG